MKNIFFLLTLMIVAVISCKNKPGGLTDDQLMEKAVKICQDNIILDSHIDWPESVYSNPRDISDESDIGDFDLVRAKKGGLNAVLSVIYINTGLDLIEGRLTVDSMFSIISAYPVKYPGSFGYAYKPEDIRNNFRNNLLSLPLCLENGAPIGDDLGYIKELKERGIVYITLCHDRSNQISDSNFDGNRPWNGLSPFGREAIKEMNRQGIMIDISHSTDSVVYQSLRISQAPIVATHSNCRHFVPGFERNLPDTLIKAIAAKNGVVMVNMGSFFLDSICNNNWVYLYYSSGQDMGSPEGIAFAREYGKTHQLFSDSRMVASHIDHIVKLAGVDHVGIGSDYDGIGIAQPSDMPDVTAYPRLVAELLKRGYSEEDISKILSGNFMRVWDNVLHVADSMKYNAVD
ncbi:MAG: dipeptidase [Bacteroidales bacterium]